MSSALHVEPTGHEPTGQIPNKRSAIPKIGHLSLLDVSRTSQYSLSVYFLAMALGHLAPH
jgi:hypothetical protein